MEQYNTDLWMTKLEDIEEMASALLPPGEIAILIGITSPAETLFFTEVCRSHAASPIYLAYTRGKLRTKFELRKTVIKLAKAGSPAAEPLADRYMIEQKSAE